MKKIIRPLLLILILSLLPAAFAEEQTDNDALVSLSSLCEQYGFHFGTVIDPYTISNKKQSEVILSNCNSVTFANEAKAYSLLNQSMCQSSPDGMPRMNFYTADKLMDWCVANGLMVRGHVLVWDAYMPDWFFRQFYMNSTAYVDSDTMRLRLESYIDQVITHFEEKYPGVIYCWDVVNEAVADNENERVPNDPRHLRATRSGASNLFLDIIGDDYVEYSFLCAYRTVQRLGADIKLFYNDYNAFATEKREAIVMLIESINNYAQDENGSPIPLIDGVGMQGYIGGYGTQNGCLNPNDIDQVRTSIQLYANHGCEAQLTEMALRCYESGEEWMQKHAEYYASMFSMLKLINQESDATPLTAVTIWGMFDCDTLPKTHYTWKLNSPYGGLFTSSFEIKPAFTSVYNVLIGE